MMLIWMKDTFAALKAAEGSMLIRFHDWLFQPNINESGKGKIDLVSFFPKAKPLYEHFKGLSKHL